MADWDASDDDTPGPSTTTAPVGPKKNRFADEDASDEDVKDDWDASDSDGEAKAAPKPAGPAPPVRQKGITKQKIAEKEAAEKARIEELTVQREDPAERKAREKAAMLKADMDTAASLFGETTLSDQSDIFSQPLNTPEDIVSLTASVSSLITSRYATSPRYALFIEQLVKGLCAPLKDGDTRKASTALAALANEKQKAQKETASGKKKSKGTSKPVLGATRNMASADTRAYEEILDDSGEYDDFM